MSRIGKMPITIPSGVEVNVTGQKIEVKGPKGSLDWECPHRVKVEIEAGSILVKRNRDDKRGREQHGLTRALVNNMVQGVTAGFQKKLEIIGVGYSAKVVGANLVLQIGFSHPVESPIPRGRFRCRTVSPSSVRTPLTSASAGSIARRSGSWPR